MALITYRHKKVPLPKAGPVSHAARVDIVQILQPWTSLRGAKLHQWGRGLRPAEDETKSAACPV